LANSAIVAERVDRVEPTARDDSQVDRVRVKGRARGSPPDLSP